MVLSGLLGKKLGMTHLFIEGGRVVPVTVMEVGPCVVTQLRNKVSDGYDAVQIGFGEAKQLNKPKQGHLKPAGAPMVKKLREFVASDLGDYQPGRRVRVDEFFVGEKVHVSALSKGRGFQGVVKRFGNAGGPKTHGQKDRHRAPGSIGAGTFPGRVYKGQKMPGHMGNQMVTVRGLQVMLIDSERNIIAVRGAIPGSRNGLLKVHHADVEVADEQYRQFLAAEEVAVAIEEPVAEETAEVALQKDSEQELEAETDNASEEKKEG
jgi:large subunit ribosomal protein L3